jgi:hypothetical protein
MIEYTMVNGANDSEIEVTMAEKHVKFKAKISEMGDKYIIIIPRLVGNQNNAIFHCDLI